ncbi:hypothetical protein [Pontibacter mangrovi]|uniref:VCBS repeat-containing protein n=1 Tax=Pontibacter mangrovi TaxID=2589816 RepID=A0A501W7J0_9BACT|nr:hypothetical protein [Pontibacter mangrovi]TPE44300.1 hypothetical protein FJM65_09105 [Pontibacter mangrovi]
MKNLLYLLPLFILACSPKNEEVKDEQVQVAPQAEALDSIASTEKDALKTDENEISPTLPLPPDVMQLLAEEYPGWEQPEIAPAAQQKAKEYASAPSLARGDFDGDSRQDVALQLAKEKELRLIVALQTQEGKYKLVELKQGTLDNGNGQSSYYLYRVAPDEWPENAELPKLAQEAIGVGTGEKARLYIYQNGTFKSYPIP